MAVGPIANSLSENAGLKIESVRAERRAQEEGREQRQEPEAGSKRTRFVKTKRSKKLSWSLRVVHGRS